MRRPQSARGSQRSISFVVVLPTLPVTATSRPVNAAPAHSRRAGVSAASVSSTRSSGPPAGTSLVHHRPGRALGQRVGDEAMAVAAHRPGQRTDRRAPACGCRWRRRWRRTARSACRRSLRAALRGPERAVSSRRGALPAPDQAANHRHIVERQDRRRRSSAPARGPCRPPPARRPGPAPFSAAAMACARSPISRAPGQAARIGGADRGGVLAARVVVGDDASRRAAPRRRPSAGACRGRGRRRRRTPRAAGPRCADAAPSAAAPARPACGRNRHRPRRRSAGARPAPCGRARRVRRRQAVQRVALAQRDRQRRRPAARCRPGSGRAAGSVTSRRTPPASTQDLTVRPRRRAQQADRVAGLADRAQIEAAPAARRRAARPASRDPCRHWPQRAHRPAAVRQTGAAWLRGRPPSAVVVQVVARQVGERSGRQPHAVQPELVEAVRGRLDRRVPDAGARAGRQGSRARLTGSGVVRPGPGSNPGAITPSVPRLAAGSRSRPRSGAGTRPCWSCRWCR